MNILNLVPGTLFLEEKCRGHISKMRMTCAQVLDILGWMIEKMPGAMGPRRKATCVIAIMVFSFLNFSCTGSQILSYRKRNKFCIVLRSNLIYTF